MFHLACFTEALGQTADTVIDPLQDDVFNIENSRFELPMDMQLLAAYASSATLLRARLNSASLRIVSPQFIQPIEVSLLPSDLPNVAEFLDNPFNIRAGEQLAMEATSGLACGTERFTGLCWFTGGLQGLPAGDIYWSRFTSTGTATANAWTTISYTLDSDLPPGEWYLVGSMVQSTNAFAHRWIVPNQLWRPGALSLTALGNATHPMFYRRQLGVWGRFRNTIRPQLQVLCNAANNSHIGYMQLMRAA